MERTIVAFCFDLRGYGQLLKINPKELAKTLQFFVNFITERIETLTTLEQVALQGDAVIGVCCCESKAQFHETIACLQKIIREQGQLKEQLHAANLAPIIFGLGIDYGTVQEISTRIPAPNGTLYVGRVISNAIRLSDTAMRAPYYYDAAVSSNVVEQGLRVAVASDQIEQIHYYFSELLEIIML
ncbi:MAG: hypothetical protein ACRCZG_01810 [Culicoidibacterales bacterium]